VARLTLETIRVCLRYRVTGLASEAGFFMLLSLPPLLLGLFGGVGYLSGWLGQDIVQQLEAGIKSFAEQYLLEGVVTATIIPTVQEVLKNGRFDLLSVGFVLSIWSGSRALNVFVDTISIMYGQSGVRGIIRTRVLSLTLYFLSLLVGIVVIPLVVIGPEWLGALLPPELHFLTYLYWPVVTILVVASVATLFHISTPSRTPWLRDLPGGVLTLVIWVLASFVLRGSLTASVRNGTSIYGPLSTPIVLLIWLYALAIAVLIGAALNAAIRVLWPVEERPSLRAQGVTWAKERLADRRAVRAGRGRASAPAGELVASVHELREEARKPLTPMPEGVEVEAVSGGSEGGAERAPERGAEAVPEGSERSQFEDGEQDRILSVRTRSG
jgi:membrane protein